MTQRITVTITVDIPAGATVTVGQSEPELADWPAPVLPPPSRPLADGPGDCPDHRVPFTWKEPGTTAQGKHYDGFWKCGEKNADGSYCKRRPQR